MAEFPLVDVEPTDERRERGDSQRALTRQTVVGAISSVEIAKQLDSLRSDLASLASDSSTGMQLSKLVFKLTLTAEGKVAFIAKGGAEASIEVTFTRSKDDAS